MPVSDLVRKMKLFVDFFRQKVPKGSRETLCYYWQSVRLNDQMLVLYFLISFLVISWSTKRLLWPPVVFQAVLLLKYFKIGKLSARLNLLLHTLLVCGWSVWYVVTFGWGLGGQHMLIVLILLVFFCLYEPPVTKLIYFLLILSLRLALFRYAATHEALILLDSFSQFLLQIINTVSVFLILAGCCIVYSSNLQETERLLLLHNEQLQVQAETDPLTRLINRRGFLDVMNRYIADHPDAMFCIAIADIDFFKRVNDTYGHNCGDYTLQKLAALFMERSHGSFFVSRWGGEEFCFFFPNVNIDEAGRIITDLLVEVRKMKLEYEGCSFSITLTAGVEENDFRSPLKELIESADRKLYRGKEKGRDQIVF
jgi:diguanylate cyclase (GGDEF) domain